MLGDELLQLLLHGPADGPPLLLGGVELGDVLAEQGQGAHRQAACALDGPVPVGDQLSGAAAQVGQQSGVQSGVLDGPPEGQLGLLPAGEHVHPQPGGRHHRPHRLLRVGDIPQGCGGEHPQVGQLQVVHEGAVALQSLTGHLDPLGGEGPVADVAGQAGHHLSVHQQADLPALALVDGQADGVGPHVRDSVDHNAVPSL